VRETPGTALVYSLCTHLGSREILLVLDDCEHLIDACATLSEALLRHCQELRILTTSREALRVPGETIFSVRPLSLPGPRRLPAVDSLSEYEVARLFSDRARAAKPDFALSGNNAMAVAQVCHRLDGIPVAIELAAARARVLSAEQISERLKESFGLLSGGGILSPPTRFHADTRPPSKSVFFSAGGFSSPDARGWLLRPCAYPRRCIKSGPG
jgi:predicted ATPase